MLTSIKIVKYCAFVALLEFAATPFWQFAYGVEDAHPGRVPNPNVWSVLIQKARAEFKRPETSQLDKAQRDLLAKMDALDQWLNRSGTHGSGWKRYFAIANLRQLIQQNRPIANDEFSQLYHLLAQCHQGFPGLELRPITDFATALERYINLHESAGETALNDFEHALTIIESSLAEGGAGFQPQLPFAAAADLLRRWNQAPELVAQIDARFSRPNLFANVSKRVAAAGIVRDLPPQLLPVRDYILGASVRGTGLLHSHVDMDLVPCNSMAVFDVLVDARHDSRNVAHKGPASVSSIGHATMHSRKRVILNESGLLVYPAMSSVTVNSRITGVGSRRGGLIGRITRRVASRRAAESKGMSEAIAAQHGEVKMNARVDQLTRSPLYEAHQWYLTQFRLRMVRNGEVPKPFRFSTTTDAIHLVARQANKGRLAASSDPPKQTPGLDIAVRLHESFVSNTGCGMLAGKERTVAEFRDFLSALIGPASGAKPRNQDPADQAKIRFDATAPLTVHFQNGGVVLEIRGADFLIADVWSGIAMNVTVRYALVRDGLGLKLVRQGEIEILPPGILKGNQLSIPQLGLRKQLLDEVPRMLTNLENRKVWNEGLNLPGAWSAAGTLELSQFGSENGWLSLGWNRVAEKRTAP